MIFMTSFFDIKVEKLIQYDFCLFGDAVLYSVSAGGAQLRVNIVQPFRFKLIYIYVFLKCMIKYIMYTYVR